MRDRAASACCATRSTRGARLDECARRLSRAPPFQRSGHPDPDRRRRAGSADPAAAPRADRRRRAPRPASAIGRCGQRSARSRPSRRGLPRVWGNAITAKTRFQRRHRADARGRAVRLPGHRAGDGARARGSSSTGRSASARTSWCGAASPSTISTTARRRPTRPGQAYFEGLDPLHRAMNARLGYEPHPDVRPAAGKPGLRRPAAVHRARAVTTKASFAPGHTSRCRLRELPDGPLMLRVTDLAFGPKARSVEYVTIGPTLFFVPRAPRRSARTGTTARPRTARTATSSSAGASRISWKTSRPRQAHFIAVEILPASVGDGPTTIPTGNN